MSEFKNGDKVVKGDRVAVYIGPSQFDGNHLVESETASLWYWSEGSFQNYVEPKNLVEVGDEWVKGDHQFIVTSVEDGHAEGLSNKPSFSYGRWIDDNILLGSLTGSYGWKKVN